RATRAAAVERPRVRRTLAAMFHRLAVPPSLVVRSSAAKYYAESRSVTPAHSGRGIQVVARRVRLFGRCGGLLAHRVSDRLLQDPAPLLARFLACLRVRSDRDGETVAPLPGLRGV